MLHFKLYSYEIFRSVTLTELHILNKIVVRICILCICRGGGWNPHRVANDLWFHRCLLLPWLHFCFSPPDQPKHFDNQLVLLNPGQLDGNEVSWIYLHGDSEMRQARVIDFTSKLSVQNKCFPGTWQVQTFIKWQVISYILNRTFYVSKRVTNYIFIYIFW